MGVAQAGLSIHGQRQQAKTQEKMQKNASAAEQQRYLSEVSASRLRERQEKIAASQQIQRTTTKAREARATARVSAGEAGVSGLSVDALINDMTRKEGEANFSIQQQMKFAEQSRAMGLDDSANRSRMNLLSINKPIEQPNYLGAILSGAQTGMSMYSAGKSAGFGAPKAASAASAASAPSFNASSAFNTSPSSYTPWTPPTTFQ
tara:strand:- start:8149 stop:8763 length:615 start_codon:yes stop_codon:yes gene_type:complete